MDWPELKQFGDLTLEDFQRHPVWVGCHGADSDEDWYDETDEETFRPWSGSLPAEPSQGMFLVVASFELNDRSRYPGFVTPAAEAGDLGTQQPHLFAGGGYFGFWGGIVGVTAEDRQAFYSALRKTPQEIFPIRFQADLALAAGGAGGQVDGFYRISLGDQRTIVER